LFGALLSAGGRKMRVLSAKPSSADLQYIVNLVAQGVIRPVIDRRYPLDQAADAVRYVGEGHAQGKVVLRVKQPVVERQSRGLVD
jgi:NADPH:quinone reductase-like Zn-dependent oxidoreductase